MKSVKRLSGIAYVMIFISGFYANFSVLESLVEMKDMKATTLNFITQSDQLIMGVLSFIVMFAFDLLLVFTLFPLTRQVIRSISLVASLFRLLHATCFAVALSHLIQIIQVLDGVSTSSNKMQELVTNALSQFDLLWTVGLLFFAIHLAILGYLLIRSILFPKLIGYLLFLAAFGYLIDGTAKLFLDNYYDYQMIFEGGVVLTGVIGELSLTIWLLFGRIGFQSVEKKRKFGVI